jgi:hypothetical protein
VKAKGVCPWLFLCLKNQAERITSFSSESNEKTLTHLLPDVLGFKPYGVCPFLPGRQAADLPPTIQHL